LTKERWQQLRLATWFRAEQDEVTEYIERLQAALAAANALIGESADEAKRLQDRIDQLEAERKDRSP
jgi:chromosome segregation ATPase